MKKICPAQNFQAKKGIFSMIRQLRPPHIFFTKLINETVMIHLIKALKVKDENTIINLNHIFPAVVTSRKDE